MHRKTRCVCETPVPLRGSFLKPKEMWSSFLTLADDLYLGTKQKFLKQETYMRNMKILINCQSEVTANIKAF